MPYNPYDRRPGYPQSIPPDVARRLLMQDRPRQYEIARDAAPADAIALAKRVLAEAGVKADVVRQSPTWRPGDVVVVFYGPQRAPYTYVRGQADWLVEAGREPKTDAFMTDQLDRGRLKPVLQSGGEPFDGGRL